VYYGSVRTASLRDTDHEVNNYEVDNEGSLAHLVGRVAAGGHTLVYGSTRIDQSGAKHRLPGSTGLAIAVGTTGRTFASVLSPQQGAFQVEVRKTFSPAVVAQFSLTDKPLAIALSTDQIAVLLEHGSQKRIEIRGLHGKLQRSVTVPSTTTPNISMSGRWVVFSSSGTIGDGDRIRLLDAQTGSVGSLGFVRNGAAGLSIDGRRVAWAETTFAASRIRAIALPK
jgi:hypothetical protein